MYASLQKLQSLPRSSRCDFTHCSLSSAVPVDCRVRAVPDGGRLSAFPPMVRRAPTAVPTAQDVWVDAERWGGVGGEAAAHGESKNYGRK
jgi:hypothetical protein